MCGAVRRPRPLAAAIQSSPENPRIIAPKRPRPPASASINRVHVERAGSKAATCEANSTTTRPALIGIAPRISSPGLAVARTIQSLPRSCLSAPSETAHRVAWDRGVDARHQHFRLAAGARLGDRLDDVAVEHVDALHQAVADGDAAAG